MKHVNPTDARLILPASIARFLKDDKRLFVVSGPTGSGRRREVQAGLQSVSAADVQWETTSYSDRFFDVLVNSKASVLVLSDYNAFNPHARAAEWYSQAVRNLLAGRPVAPPVGCTELPASTMNGEESKPGQAVFSGKLVLLTEPQQERAFLPEGVDGIEYYDSHFDLYNYVYRTAESLSSEYSVESEALYESLEQLRLLCMKAPEFATKPAPGGGLSVPQLMRSADRSLSPAERQFLLGTDIHQYVLARDTRSAADRPGRPTVADWPTWDYSAALEVDGLRLLMLLPSIVQWFAESNYQTYVVVYPKDGFTRARLRSAVEQASASITLEEPSGPEAVETALNSGESGARRLIWIDPDDLSEIAASEAVDAIPRVVAQDSFSDRVGRVVWFPDHFTKRKGPSLRELEELVPKLYDLLAREPLESVERPATDLPTAEELVERVMAE